MKKPLHKTDSTLLDKKLEEWQKLREKLKKAESEGKDTSVIRRDLLAAGLACQKALIDFGNNLRGNNQQSMY
jgi:hypothetical protein